MTQRLIVVYEFDDYAKIDETVLANVRSALSSGTYMSQGMGFPQFTRRTVTVENVK